jgi:hypothetical protein
MAIDFDCPACGKHYDLHASLAGRRARCKACGAEMRIPSGSAPGPATHKASAPPADLFDDVLPPRTTGMPDDDGDDDAPPAAPPRAGADTSRPKPRRKARHTLEGRIPPLIRFGLGGIGLLLSLSALGLAGVALSQGRADLAVAPLAMLAFVVVAGLAAWSHLKLLFMGIEEGSLAAMWQQLLAPLLLPGFIARNWEATRGWLAAYVVGLVGVVAWFAIAPGYLNANRPRPLGPGGMPGAPPGFGTPGFGMAPPPTAAQRLDALERSDPPFPANPSEPAQATPAPRPEPTPSERLDQVMADLRSPELQIRRNAVGLIRRMPPDDARKSEVQTALQPLLGDADGILVNDTIDALVAWLTPETVLSLLPRTTDDRMNVRWHAIQTLGNLADPRAAQAIAARLEDDAVVAINAMKTLGAAGEAALIEQLSSPRAGQRMSALEVLRDIGGQATLAFMQNARPDPDPGVQAAARATMQAIAQRVGSNR